MIKLIAFDADGVLVSSVSAHIELVHRLSKELRFPLVAGYPEKAFSEMRTKCSCYGIEGFLEYLGVPKEFIPMAVKRYSDGLLDSCGSRLYPPTERVLKCLKWKGYSLGVLSRNHPSNFQRVLNPIRGLLDFELVGLGLDKTDALEKLARSYNLQNNEMVYVGDLSMDQKVARKAGVQFIGSTYGWGFENDSGLEFEISDLARLPSVLNSMELGYMGASDRFLLNDAVELFWQEYYHTKEIHPCMHSFQEVYSVLYEEVEEFRAGFQSGSSLEELLEEIIQVGAMSIAVLIDLGKSFKLPLLMTALNSQRSFEIHSIHEAFGLLKQHVDTMWYQFLSNQSDPKLTAYLIIVAAARSFQFISSLIGDINESSN